MNSANNTFEASINKFDIPCTTESKFNELKKIRSIPEDYKNALNTSIHTTIDDLNKNIEGVFDLSIGSARFDCYYKNNNSNRLYVMLRANKGPNGRTVLFQRWTYGYYLNANILAINNPMYYLSSELYCGWYLGTKEEDYIKYTVKLVKKMCNLHEIPISNVVFMGSSSAGTAAIHCCCNLPTSSSFSINPQILPNVGIGMKDDYAKIGVNLDELGNNRINTTKLLKESNSRNIICANIRSDRDLQPLMEIKDDLEINLNYGWNLSKNKLTAIWLFDAYGVRLAHGTFEDRPMLYAIDYIIQCFQNGKEIDSNIIKILSEFWFERFNYETSHISEIFDLIKNPNKIKSLTNEFPYQLNEEEWENPEISYKLSKMYDKGEGIEQNIDAAIYHLGNALHLDSSYAGEYCNMLSRRGTKKDLDSAYKIALKYAPQGDQGCQFYIARAYLSGKGTEKNLNEAIRYLEQTYSINNWAKKLLLEALWNNGLKSEVKLFEYAKKFVQDSIPEAYYYLGCAFLEGKGTQINYIEAKKWLSKASDNGITLATAKLSQINA